MKTARLKRPWGQAPLQLNSSTLLLAGLLCIVLISSAMQCSVSSVMLSSALQWSTLCFASLCTGLLHSTLEKHGVCLNSAREMQCPSLVESTPLSQRAAGLSGQKPPPRVADWSESSQSDWSKGTELISQTRAAPIGQSFIILIAWGKPQPNWLK